jgi:hypothetical protein
MNKFKALICTLPVLALASCAPNDQVSFNSGGVKQTISEGSKALNGSFPLPIYPGATPAGSVAGETEGADRSEFIMVLTNDDVDKVSLYYRNELKKQGWQMDRVDTIGLSVNFACHKGTTEGSVMITGEGKQTTITLQAGRLMEHISPPKDENFVPNKDIPATD